MSAEFVKFSNNTSTHVNDDVDFLTFQDCVEASKMFYSCEEESGMLQNHEEQHRRIQKNLEDHEIF